MFVFFFSFCDKLEIANEQDNETALTGGKYMASGKISAKQQEILDYIKDEILKKGYPPTVREICETVSLKSTSSVHSHLETLEKNGYIRRDPTKPRAIEICDDSFQMIRTEMVNLPIMAMWPQGSLSLRRRISKITFRYRQTLFQG